MSVIILQLYIRALLNSTQVLFLYYIMALSIKTTNFIVYLITVTLLLQIKQTTCDLFTALAHMERMITVEDVLLTNLKNYVSTQRQILDFLKK